MTRKDTILIAVVINAGLLAILFMTAVIYDTDTVSEPTRFPTSLVDNQLSPQPRSELIASASTGDEVDNVLQYYNPPEAQSSIVQNRGEPSFSIPIQSPEAGNENVSAASITPNEQLIEIKVKRGDVLEKIAKANRTTVSAIKRANHLENERLTIGQILKIPPKPKDALLANSLTQGEVEPKQETSSSSLSTSENEPVYYTVKSGDNPWKIAKQFGVKYDEILRLNRLDEEKARNLKIGDRIRVK